MRLESQISTVSDFCKPVNPESIAVAKNEKLLPDILKLLTEYGSQKGLGSPVSLTRQRMLFGDTELKLVRANDTISFLEDGVSFAITSLDAICNWAALNGYKNWPEVTEQFDVRVLGIGRCTVEVACKPKYTDIVDAFTNDGLTGIRNIMCNNNYSVATDVPGIARYFFPEIPMRVLGGSLELVTNPVIIGIVQTGDSLKEEGWVRLSQIRREAILINSQTCLIRRRQKCP